MSLAVLMVLDLFASRAIGLLVPVSLVPVLLALSLLVPAAIFRRHDRDAGEGSGS